MGINAYFGVATTLFFSLIWIGVMAFLRFSKKKNFPYLFFLTLFYIYLFKVFDYTLFQFQSLLILKYFMPNLILRGQTAETSINLIPLVLLATQDLQTSLLNILLFIPFGFGLPFISRFRMVQIITAGFLVSILIEFLQLVTGIMAQITFRIADINDVIFNTAGVGIGYSLFLCIHLYSHKFGKSKNPMLKYIVERSRFV